MGERAVDQCHGGARVVAGDGELAHALLGTVRAQGEMFRQYEGFGVIVPVPADASAFDRALSLYGRDPQWKPGT